MKNLVILLTFLTTFFVYSQDESSNLDWLLDLNEALEISKNEQKPLLVYFTIH